MRVRNRGRRNVIKKITEEEKALKLKYFFLYQLCKHGLKEPICVGKMKEITQKEKAEAQTNIKINYKGRRRKMFYKLFKAKFQRINLLYVFGEEKEEDARKEQVQAE